MHNEKIDRLVRKARRGNKGAFCELIELKAHKILYIATQLMGNKEDGEDAAQEAIIKIARNISRVKKAELFDAWLYKVVYTVCLSERQKRMNCQIGTVDFETASATLSEKNNAILPEASMEKSLEKEKVMAAIDKLPVTYRMCLLLYYYEDLSYANIASTLNINEQTVANILHRAKTRLRDILEAEEPGLSTSTKASALIPSALIVDAFTLDDSMTITPLRIEMFKQTIRASSESISNWLVFSGLISRLIPNVGAKAVVVAVFCLAAIGIGSTFYDTTAKTSAVEGDSSGTSEQGTATGSSSLSQTEGGQGGRSSTTYSDDGWNDFALKNGLTHYQFGIGADARYDTYVFIDPDTAQQWGVITRKEGGGSSIQVVYKEISDTSELPDGKAVVDMFNEWSQ